MVKKFYNFVTFIFQDEQRKTIAKLVGSDELAAQYVQDFDSEIYLARGHLSPNADFIFYSWMDSTYHFVNVAPQWQRFNGNSPIEINRDLKVSELRRKLDVF